MKRSFLTIVILLALLGGIPSAPGQFRLPDNSGGTSPAEIAAPTFRTDPVRDTLRWDDGSPYYAFRFPDVYGDDFRNQRFRAPSNCTLVGALFVFGTRGGRALTTGDPSLVSQVWSMGPDSFPVLETPLRTDTLPYSAFSASVYNLDSAWRARTDQFVAVEFSSGGLALDSGEWFHVGYTALRNSADDSLAIIADDGYPSGNRASEYYQGHFVPMWDGWPDVNFFIRAVVELDELGVRILPPAGMADAVSLHPAYPNPFNPVTTISFYLPAERRVQLTVFDLLGRLQTTLLDGPMAAGSHRIQLDGREWSSGVYFVRLQTADEVRLTKIILEK